VLAALLLTACSPEPPSGGGPIAHPGTYVRNTAWASAALRPPSSSRGLTVRLGEIALIEGDADLVSGAPPSLGLRVDEERNDPGRVMARYVAEVADVPGILVLFTSFDDQGAGGDGYFLPVWNDTSGTGLERIDQRESFGTSLFEGFVNLKDLSRHDRAVLPSLAAHEIAHRHLAYLHVATGSTSPEILGRQRAHWHAALDSEGSLLEGYDWLENGAGRFVTVGRSVRFSMLDLYGLGLAPAEEVPPFFFIEGARTSSGALIPAEAQLPNGTTAFGSRVDLSIDDVIRAIGPRSPTPPELRVVFALLVAPGEDAESETIAAMVEEIDALRLEIEARWSELTLGRGALCTKIAGCEPPVDGGAPDGGAEPPADGCGCRATRGARVFGGGLALMSLLLLYCFSRLFGLASRICAFSSDVPGARPSATLTAMVSAGRRRHRYTYAQYVALEKESSTKHEFFDGEIYAMAGGSEDHSALAVRVMSALDAAIGDRPCRVHDSDLRIYVEAVGLATFPDGSVICGPLEQHPPSPDSTALNPVILLEVTSDSSEDYDTGEKLEAYRTISTLRECIVVSHRERRITVHRRDDAGGWTMRVAIAGGKVAVATLGTELVVDAIYRNSSIM
jgi:Uma2 family endonuclease